MRNPNPTSMEVDHVFSNIKRIELMKMGVGDLKKRGIAETINKKGVFLGVWMQIAMNE